MTYFSTNSSSTTILTSDIRLELDFPDMDFADLLLTKLQIHYVNDKDLLDIIGLSTHDKWDEEANAQRIVGILSNDWGFYYDAVNNLRAAASRATELLNQLSTSTKGSYGRRLMLNPEHE